MPERDQDDEYHGVRQGVAGNIAAGRQVYLSGTGRDAVDGHHNSSQEPFVDPASERRQKPPDIANSS